MPIVVETLVPTAASVQANIARLREYRDMLRAKYKKPVKIDGWEFRGGIMAVRWIIDTDDQA